MKNTNLAIATESSYLSIDCKAEIARLEKEIALKEKKYRLLTAKKHYSDQDIETMNALQNDIDNFNRLLCSYKTMSRFQKGQWVHNGTPTPGKIIDFRRKLPDNEPIVAVDYEGEEKNERPAQLTTVDDSYLEWIWTGENFPKLIRRGDKIECDRLEILAQEYKSSLNLKTTHEECNADPQDIEPYQKKVAYCKKRYLAITRDRFPAGTRVSVGGEIGIVGLYPTKLPAYLPKVEIKLNNGSVIKRYPTEIELAPEVDKDKESKLLKFCSRKPEVKTIAIADIRRNGGTQQRTAINHETVKEYAEAMREGDRFPPVKLMFDGQDYWLLDGFHTTEAAWSIGSTEIEAEVTQGTQRDAILASVGVNTNHGLRRSNADKRKAVTTLLEDDEWGQWSNREIAKRCKVSHTMVNKIRENLTGNVSSERIYTDKHGNESVMQTQNIGSFPDKTDNSTDNQDSNSPDKTDTVSLSCPDKEKDDSDKQHTTGDLKLSDWNKNLIKHFEVGQLVCINSDRSDKRLVGYNHSIGVITVINSASVNLKLHGATFDSVSPNDIELINLDEQLTLCHSISVDDYAKSIMMFDSKEDIIKAAIAARSLQL